MSSIDAQAALTPGARAGFRAARAIDASGHAPAGMPVGGSAAEPDPGVAPANGGRP